MREQGNLRLQEAKEDSVIAEIRKINLSHNTSQIMSQTTKDRRHNFKGGSNKSRESGIDMSLGSVTTHQVSKHGNVPVKEAARKLNVSGPQ